MRRQIKRKRRKRAKGRGEKKRERIAREGRKKNNRRQFTSLLIEVLSSFGFPGLEISIAHNKAINFTDIKFYIIYKSSHHDAMYEFIIKHSFSKLYNNYNNIILTKK